MIEHKEHFHGSDLEKIEAAYGIKKEDITSFSANVNPLGISYKLREGLMEHIDAITSYPDREYTSLRKCIAEYTGTDYRNILVGNGSTELISLVIQLKHPKKALIVGPTYSEYEHELSLEGGRSHYFRLKESDDFKLNIDELTQALDRDIDLLVLCNPNNPTSSQIDRQSMRIILDTCKEKGIFVMVDETYVEFSEKADEITSIPLTNYYNNIIILRGISKFFAAPGLRLGYAICGNHQLLQDIDSKKNPWTINSLAAVAGEIMFQDKEYIHDTKELISSERRRICGILDKCPNIKYYPPHGNFILVRILRDDVTSMDLFEAAIRKGLMIRDCSTFPFLDNKYIRFCFMNPADNDALLDVLFEQLNK
ncbi:histidinol-phosphate/aromatic aminotransferase and cobyric acid decarboxylase [Roseburia sp. CAG:380]|jgi:threonine-phosphate decarboxylase|nr:histidinol-phosphate/aromatic aminotransferase and cobyric acid decarboxylase [Roseburia sp. CAG:380]HCS14587.1 threonine-phosphate decarboxylase [Lachnospiraceae bacterium]